MGIKFRALDAMGNAIFRFLAFTTQEGTLEEAGIDVEGHDPRLHPGHIHLGFTPTGNPRLSGTLLIQCELWPNHMSTTCRKCRLSGLAPT